MYPEDIVKLIDGKKKYHRSVSLMRTKLRNKKWQLFSMLFFVISTLVLANVISNPIGKFIRSFASSPNVQVAGDLESKVNSSSRTKILVMLVNDVKTEKELNTKDLNNQRNTIKSMQDSVKNALIGTNSKVTNSYPSIPFMSIEVDRAGLERLKTLKGIVKTIAEDKANKVNLRDSRIIIGANKYEKIGDNGYNGKGMTLADVDSGVESTHPFLTGKIINEVCFSDCPNGEDFQEGPGAAIPCTYSTDCKHGTLTAGAIVGEGTGAGGISPDYKGIAPKASLVSMRVVTPVNCRDDDNNPSTPDVCDTSYYDTSIVGALSWIYEHRDNYIWGGVSVSLSDGITATNYCDNDLTMLAYTFVLNNLESVNIPVVFASGNSGSTNGIDHPACNSVGIPAAAVRKDDQMSYVSTLSTFHNNLLLAPGEDVISSTLNGGMLSVTGSSFAAPQIAAAYAILRQASLDLTVDERTELLKSTAKMLPDNRPNATGALYPRIQIDKALESLFGAILGDSCSSNSGTSTSCNMTTNTSSTGSNVKNVLGNSTSDTPQVLATTSSYGKMLIVSASYQAYTNPSSQVYRMTYCNYPMSRLGGLLGRSSYSAQHVELWYLVNPPTPPVGYCSFQAFFANDTTGAVPSDPGPRIFTGAIFSDVLQNDFIAGHVLLNGYNYPPGSKSLNISESSQKDTRLICSYSTYPNNLQNIITPTDSPDWKELIGSKVVYKDIQSAIGISFPRRYDNQSVNIQWKSTQSYPWAEACINLKVKPMGTNTQPPATPAPVPPAVDLKINNSNGPININKGDTLTATWNATFAPGGCVTSWGGGQVEGQTGTSVIPSNFVGSQSFSILCVGADPASRATDSVTVNSAGPVADTRNQWVNLWSVTPSGPTDGPVLFSENQTVNISWQATEAHSCQATASPSLLVGIGGNLPNNGDIPTEGSIDIPLGSSIGGSVGITCKGKWGMSRDILYFVKSSRITNNTVTLTANNSYGPYTAPSGSGITLRWNTLATSGSTFKSCVASGNWTGTKTTSGSVSLSNVSAGHKKYKLVCTYSIGSNNYTTSAEVYVNVESASATPPATVKSGDQGWLERFYKSDPGTAKLDNTSIFNSLKISRINPYTINYDWGSTSSPDYNLVGSDYYSGRWTAQMIPWKTGAYNFIVTFDDAARVKVGNTYVINSWTTGNRQIKIGTINLVAGWPYDVTQEFFEKTGGSVMISNVGYDGDSGPAEVYLISSDNGITP